MSKSIAIILYEGCSLNEVMDFISLFGDDNPVIFINGSKDGSGVITTVEGLSLNLSGTLPRLRENTYDCVIVAGGNVASVIKSNELDVFLLENHRNPRTIIGGICNGAWVLAKAGILKGKTVTHTAHPSCDAPTEIIDTAAPYFEGSVYSLENVVIDGRIVTAKPWAKAEFTVRMVELVGLLEKDRIEFFLQYLKGDHRVDIGC